MPRSKQIKNSDLLNSLTGFFSVNFENLLNLPCYVFWKNLQGIYLGYNDYGANNLGYRSGKEIAGKDDYEIFPNEIADLYRQNDTDVIQQNRQILVPEKGVLKNSGPIIFLSYKMPLYHQNEIAGVIGLSFTRSIDDALCSIPTEISLTKFADSSNYCPQNLSPNSLTLSNKEKECVRYLCQGLTLKMIAQRLGISPKTVETYIERAKVKLNCHNKTQLIMTYIKLCPF